MAICYYCGKHFKNKQAVRSHLRACYPWIHRAELQGFHEYQKMLQDFNNYLKTKKIVKLKQQYEPEQQIVYANPVKRVPDVELLRCKRCGHIQTRNRNEYPTLEKELEFGHCMKCRYAGVLEVYEGENNK
jgi:hypothetical protein